MVTTHYRGWCFDIYPHHCDDGVVVWLIGEDGQRLRLRYALRATFYVGGSAERLRAVWRYLRADRSAPQLSRVRRQLLEGGWQDVLSADVAQIQTVSRLHKQLRRRFPDLDYYDVDLPAGLRFAFATGVFPTTLCRVEVDAAQQIVAIESLEDRWSLESPLPLRVMTLVPDHDPNHQAPTTLTVTVDDKVSTIALDQSQRLIAIRLNALLTRHDPDVLLTAYGDGWLFPFLLDAEDAPPIQLNRDSAHEPQRRRETSLVSYGQVLHRSEQVTLFGRWHIDGRNAMMWQDYGMEGAIAQARVGGLSVQQTSRRSPGATINALQMMVALERDILIPYEKRQVEHEKSARELINADKGGLVFQPKLGVYQHAIEVDFISMYPSIMVQHNLSAEKMMVDDDSAETVPETSMRVSQREPGLITSMLQPLLAKRIAIKRTLSQMDSRDSRYARLKAISAGLKWCLVVSFGYSGYRRAKFGRIEAHQAITAYSRRALLDAKSVGEELGYTFLHGYVDGLWFYKPNHVPTQAEVDTLLTAIEQRTSLPIAFEGRYRWIAFLPSKSNDRIAVPNRFFGVFSNGEPKIRGLEMRRRDAPPLVVRVQNHMIAQLGRAAPETVYTIISALCRMLRKTVENLNAGLVEVEQLIITQIVSKELDQYVAPPAVARAASLLSLSGKTVRPGMRVRFVHTIGRPGVFAWDAGQPLTAAAIDTARYCDLLYRAAWSVLQPFGLQRDWLLAVMHGTAYQPELPLYMIGRVT